MSAFTVAHHRTRPISLPTFYIPLPRPRRRTLLIAALLLVGLTMPWLMALNILPTTLFMGFIDFACLASGGVLALIFCGEIH